MVLKPYQIPKVREHFSMNNIAFWKKFAVRTLWLDQHRLLARNLTHIRGKINQDTIDSHKLISASLPIPIHEAS